MDSCTNFSHMTYPLARVHPLQTDIQTDGKTTTKPIARPLHRHGLLKINIYEENTYWIVVHEYVVKILSRQLHKQKGNSLHR